MIKNCFSALQVLLFALVLLPAGAMAQDSTGWPVYDSIKIELRSGIMGSKFIPFDVPFYLYGNADKIQSIHLRIIDASYQACCGGEFEINDEPSNGNCDCDCKSIFEKRLEFFRLIRRYKRGDLDTLSKNSETLRKASKALKKIIDQYHSGDGFRNNELEIEVFSDVKQIYLRKPYSPDPSRVPAEMDRLNATIRFLKNLKGEKPSLQVDLSLIGGSILLSNELRTNMNDSAFIMKFLLRREEYRLTKLEQEIRKEKTLGENDSSRLTAFRKSYSSQLERWKGYLKNTDEMIKSDSMALCPNCEFDPRRCNTICSWDQNMIIGKTKNFHLSIPALEAHRNYKFFFEVARNVDDNEGKGLKFYVTRSLIIKIDSVVGKIIDTFWTEPYDVEKITNALLTDESYTILDSKILKELITGHLNRQYGNQLKAESIFIDKIQDQFARKKLINAIIANRLYRAQIDWFNFWNNTKGPFRHLKPFPKNVDIRNKQFAFTAAGKQDDYARLYTLQEIFGQDSAPSEIDFVNLFKAISKDVPGGSIPYVNLQTVEMRNLDMVNDFSTKTVTPYIRNLSDYLDFLSKIQTFVGNEIVQNKNGLRGKIFGTSGPIYETPSGAGGRDKDLKEDWAKYYLTLDNHRNDVTKLKNVYTNYRSNIDSINRQAKFLIDSLLKDNRTVQIAAARTAGGLTSADFVTRSQWSVTADIGIALIPISTGVGASITPYFGANFNFHPLNKQVDYGLLRTGKQQRYLSYDQVSLKLHSRGHPFWRRMWKGTSAVLGVTTTSLKKEGVRENLMANGTANLNLLTGIGIRLTDGGRLSTGAIWTRDINPNPLINNDSRIVANWYVSLSFDLDVKKALGKVGELLSP